MIGEISVTIVLVDVDEFIMIAVFDINEFITISVLAFDEFFIAESQKMKNRIENFRRNLY